jgi:hypothetical protein
MWTRMTLLSNKTSYIDMLHTLISLDPAICPFLSVLIISKSPWIFHLQITLIDWKHVVSASAAGRKQYFIMLYDFLGLFFIFHFFIEFKTLPLLNKEFHIMHKWNLFKKVELFSTRTIIISSNRFRGKKLCPTTLVIIPNFSSNYIIAKTLKYHE